MSESWEKMFIFFCLPKESNLFSLSISSSSFQGNKNNKENRRAKTSGQQRELVAKKIQ